MNPARKAAFDCILKIQQNNSYSNLAVAAALKDAGLSGPDKALFTNLVYGVVERKITLDYNLSQYLTQPLKKLNPKAYVALLMGTYQILFLDKVPDHAAINESVELTKIKGAKFAGNLVNAVLHIVVKNGMVLPEEPLEGTTEEKEAYYSVKYSFPTHLVHLWMEAYGEEDAVGIMASSLGAQPVCARVNTTKITPDELVERLAKEGVTATLHETVPDALVLTEQGAVEQLPSYLEGLFHVQDASSQLCCARLDPQPGDTVFDLCAAPGGKTFTLAERMENTGNVVAFDLHEHRVKLIADGAARLGLSNVTSKVGNAALFNAKLGLADKVLCDVPCAGLGIVGRKPEIRYKAVTEIDGLPPLQYNILQNASRYLRPGGRLVYSTCSLNPAENEAVVNRFLSDHPDFRLGSMETLLPHRYHTDGFFISVLEKVD